ncbi:hypothetical protein BUZ00_07190 [Staphylococcus gallinarum]|uniref:hypothetical protein n=1 Tax=Staphylococcus gallinarum TaxID=1293 RepID=UPI000D1CA25D|nr:hypothetical protein [Staphylococcus gallinarum]PTE35758.1 hypothetical protein BUZ00_07190 [Staphylococcus gallinarum]
METQWYLSELYKNVEDWEKQFSKINKKVSDLEFDYNSVLKSIKILDSIYTDLDSLHTYSLLDYELKIHSKEKRTNLEKIESLYDVLHHKSENFNNYIYNNLEEIIELINDTPNMNIYKYYYTNLFPKQRVKNSSLDSLYNSLNIRNYYDYVFYNDELFCSFIHKGINYNINTSNFLHMLTVDNRELRKKVYVKTIEKLSNQKTHAAFILNTYYQMKNEIAISNGSESYFDNLLKHTLFKIDKESFNKESERIADLFKKTIDIRRKLMGYETISHYDLYYLGNSKSFVSFESSKSILKNAFKIFGEKYTLILEEVFEKDWVHFEKSSNKRLGARSYSSYNSHPYIILNWENDLESLFALAHEIGGAIAQYLSQSSNSILYSETSELKTEFMSFINEMVLLEHLLNSNYVEISKKELKYKFLEILKDDLFVPFEYINIIKALSTIAKKGSLNENLISEEYNKIIMEFRDYNKFHNIEVNKWNWIKGHEGLMIEYNIYYIQAFLFAINYQYVNFEKVLNLLKKGEQIDDFKFFSNIFGKELDFQNFNSSGILKINNIITDILE